MKFRHVLLPTFLGLAGSLIMTLAAEAGTLQSWRFTSSNNQLVFTTDDRVQPRAQLLQNPARLVLDLPNTTVGSVNLRQLVGGAIREVRVGQFDSQTARIVIELAPGYTLNPDQIVVRGRTPTEWTVQIPTPEPDQFAESPESPDFGNAPTPNPRVTSLDGVQITRDGIFLRTSGAVPRVERQRARDRNRVTFDLENTVLSPQLAQSEVSVNRFGISRLQITQADNSPPTARVTLTLSDRNNTTPPQWQASATQLGGVALVPGRGTSGGPVVTNPPTQPDPQPLPPSAQLATIQSVSLNGNQLLIRANQPVRYSSGWDRSSGSYRILIPNAQLAERVTGPRLVAGSLLQRVRLLQQDEQTVAILVEPSSGTTIQEVAQLSRQILALQLDQSRPATPPSNPLPPDTTPPVTNLPRVPTGRYTVTIDPGHGGVDPGAVGRGGLRETDVVLPVSLEVASILEQQGIQVVLTRRGNQTVELEPRVQIAEQARADIFVSIHSNAISMDRPEVNGTETYYYSDAGARLGRVIHSSMMQSSGFQDRGLRQARFYVIRNTSMPAVLLELGYVTGAQDAPQLSNPQWRSRMAQAIARGILQYIQQNISTSR